MNKFIFTCLLSLICASLTFAKSNTGIWTEVEEARYAHIAQHRVLFPSSYRMLKLDVEAVKMQLTQVPLESDLGYGNAMASNLTLQLPFPDGSFHTFRVVESPIMSDKVARTFPSVKTYLGACEDLNGINTRITVGDMGLDAIVLGFGEGTFYVTPYVRNSAVSDAHIAYYLKDLPEQEWSCATEEEIKTEILQGDHSSATPMAGDCRLRVYRMGVCVTGEYTAWAGTRTKAYNNIVSTVNNLSAVYENAVAIRFQLVTDSNTIYANAASDPFPTVTFPNGTTLQTNHNTLVSALGSNGFEVGSVYNRGWNGGLAMLSGVCTSSNKGRSACGTTTPIGGSFEVVVLHEVGHLFNATHTHNSTSGQCGGGNFSSGSSWEAGGGISIMSYGNVCTGNSYGSPTNYFNLGSINQISQKILSTSCAFSINNLSNTAPSASVSATSYTIPKGTPFRLSMTAADPDGDQLWHQWDQQDANNGSSTLPQPTQMTGPMHRAWAPSNNSTRYIPALFSFSAYPPSHPWEVLSTVARQLKFKGNANDRKAGGACSKEVDVTVNVVTSSGPFKVTSQDTLNTAYEANGTNTMTITWDVANTTAAPVSCPNVDILFSSTNAIDFTTVLLANTPNDGSETLVVPSVSTLKARIMVACSNNIFHSLNDRFFKITVVNGISSPIADMIENIYPNPANSQLNVAIAPNKAGEISLDVFDMQGRLLSGQRLNVLPGSQEVSLDVSDLMEGVYILKIQTAEGMYPHCFVIER